MVLSLHYILIVILFLCIGVANPCGLSCEMSDKYYVSDDNTYKSCDDMEPEEVDNHLASSKCTLAQGKKVINPYLNYNKNNVAPKLQSSACLKCYTCLAIAKQFSDCVQGLLDVDEISIEVWTDYVKQKLYEICEVGFKDYGLREFEQRYFMGPASLTTNHVATEMDGKWPNKLKEDCKKYVDNLDLNFVYNEATKGSIKWDDLLCRKGGIFRDCTNMIFKPIVMPEMDDSIMSICFICEEGKENQL